MVREETDIFPAFIIFNKIAKIVFFQIERNESCEMFSAVACQ